MRRKKHVSGKRRDGEVSIGTAALIVVLGMAVVFFGLILLMYVTKIAGAIISRKKSAEPLPRPPQSPLRPL